MRAPRTQLHHGSPTWQALAGRFLSQAAAELEVWPPRLIGDPSLSRVCGMRVSEEALLRAGVELSGERMPRAQGSTHAAKSDDTQAQERRHREVDSEVASVLGRRLDWGLQRGEGGQEVGRGEFSGSAIFRGPSWPRGELGRCPGQGHRADLYCPEGAQVEGSFQLGHRGRLLAVKGPADPIPCCWVNEATVP